MKNNPETLFASLAATAGFIVEQPKAIRIDEPVKDKNGELTKVVTCPDFYVTNPLTQLGMHVEVTKRAGSTPHKEAQQRVVDAAGVANYIQLTGNQILSLQGLHPTDIFEQVCTYFGWPQP